ncbi:hypothetical protein Q9966_012174 [Columba livia]|nr:hypothetical protein Q9966_012174 [Columba livia]
MSKIRKSHGHIKAVNPSDHWRCILVCYTFSSVCWRSNKGQMKVAKPLVPESNWKFPANPFANPRSKEFTEECEYTCECEILDVKKSESFVEKFQTSNHKIEGNASCVSWAEQGIRKWETPSKNFTQLCGPKLSIGDQWAALPAASSEQGSTQSFEFHLGKARLPLQMARHALLLEDDQGHQSPQA